MTLRMTLDRVLIRREAAPEMQGGLHVPQVAQGMDSAPACGVVLSVGAGRINSDGSTRICPQVRSGLIVLYNRYAVMPMQVQGEVLDVVGERDIYAVVEG